MNRTALYAAAALVLLFAACELLGPEPGTEGGPEGKAAVHIAITASGAQGRTALPAVELEDVTAWELWGGKPPEPQKWLADLSGISETVYLETGDWDFTVKGFNEDGALILQGTLPEQTISFDKPNTLPFAVAPHMDGEGRYQITIKLPPGHGITTAKVFSRDNAQIAAFPLDSDTVVFVFEEDYPAGDYYFSVRLYKDATLYGVVSETAQVRANLLSEAEEYTLTAEDLNIVYTINYYLDEGEFDNAVENPGFYQSVDFDFTLPEPTRKGHTFEGWRVIGGEKAPDIITQGSTGDKDFYAEWTPITYTIQYDANGGETGSTASSTHTYDVEKSLTLNGFKRKGYDFEQWADGDGAFYNDGDSVVNLRDTAGEVMLYTRWTAINYPIKYKLYGGNDPENPPTYTIEDIVSLKTPTHNNEDYRFGGWYDNGEFNGNKITSIEKGSTEEKTFHAKWDPLAPITIDLQEAPTNPTLASVYVAAGEDSIFNTGTGYTEYAWYWNGELIDEATAESYTRPGSLMQPGIYELSVVATDTDDRKLSARLQVIIMTKQGGAE